MTTTADQSETETFLAGIAGGDGICERVDTHISTVFLGRGRVWKLKKAALLPYADFSTAPIRLAMCEREVELNRRTAPSLYLGVRCITRGANGLPEFDGKGELLDAVVEMRRFAEEDLFDRMATEGRLTPELAEELAASIAGFQKNAQIRHPEGGGAAAMSRVLDINLAGFRDSGLFEGGEVSSLDTLMRSRLEELQPLLDERQKAGACILGHGDLHLRNICLFDGQPTLFDCIEFSEEIATVDVLYDLAFLLMDLWHRDLPDLANIVMNRWMDETGDIEGIAALSFFMAVRAAVRAHVEASRATTADGDAGQSARSYLDLAFSLLERQPPQLLAIGGLSGSGKSTIARLLAPATGTPPGARLVESDRQRKAMFGVAPQTRLPQEAYTSEVSRKVYQRMLKETQAALRGGASVIANAVYDRSQDRSAIRDVAHSQTVGFTGVWLDVGADILRKRVADRKKGASDATTDVLEGQLERAETADRPPAEWHRVDASRQASEVAESISRLLKARNE